MEVVLPDITFPHLSTLHFLIFPIFSKQFYTSERAGFVDSTLVFLTFSRDLDFAPTSGEFDFVPTVTPNLSNGLTFWMDFVADFCFIFEVEAIACSSSNFGLLVGSEFWICGPCPALYYKNS